MLNLKMASLLKYNAIMLRETQSVAVPLTNQHVVPYNPHLLMLLGCHVNVEFCANLLGSIMYIHKYIPRVLIMSPLLSLQMVTLMRYAIIKTAATLVLLKQCGKFSNSLYTAALQLSTGFSCIFKERIKSILIQTNPLRLHSNVQQTRGPCWMHFTE